MGTDASASRLLSSWQPVMEFTAPTTMYRVCPHATRIYLYIAPIVVSRSGVAMARTILHSCAKHPRHSTAHHHGWFFVVVVVAVFASHHSTHSWSVVYHVFGNVLQRFYWFNVTTQNIHGERETGTRQKKAVQFNSEDLCMFSRYLYVDFNSDRRIVSFSLGNIFFLVVYCRPIHMTLWKVPDFIGLPSQRDSRD